MIIYNYTVYEGKRMYRFLDPKNDLAFKTVFGEAKHKDILISFLNDIFDGVQEKIEDVEFLKLNQDPEVAAYRQSIVDVKCSDTQGRQLDHRDECASDSAIYQKSMRLRLQSICRTGNVRYYRDVIGKVSFP